MMRYKIYPERLIDSGLIGELTEGEMRVLLTLIACDGESDADKLSTLSGASPMRVASALTLFTEGEIIAPLEGVKISEEFDTPHFEGQIEEESSLSVARGIRDAALASVIEDFARYMNKPLASPLDVKRITALATQYELSAEYISLYMAHLKETGRLSSSHKLAAGAIKLAEEGIISAESLAEYIKVSEERRGEFYELRRLLGIWDRRLSKSEEQYFNRWAVEFAFGIDIIGEAYDITVLNTRRAELRYMDKLLTAWHEAGVKTLDGARAEYEKSRAEEAKKRQAAPPKEKKPEKSKPRYGDFDPNEALLAAIARSQFSDDEDNK